MEKYIPTIGDVVLYGGGTAPKVVVDMKKSKDMEFGLNFVE